MPDNKEDNLDLDYIILTALMAGSLTAIATTATLLAKPALVELGKQLPLPSLQAPPSAPRGER